MSLNHEFLLLDRTVAPVEGFSTRHHSPDALVLHDDLVHYINDVLSWVPTESVDRKRTLWMGLHLYGPTVISQRGAPQLRAVCNALASLFALGPEVLILRGLYACVEGSTEAGSYDRLEVPRDELVGKLRTLATWAGAVEENSDMYILHLGI